MGNLPDGLRRWLPALALALALLLLPQLALAAPLTVVSQGPAVVGGVDRIVVHSARVGRDFVVDVAAPKPQEGEKLPAIYALDGGYGVAIPVGSMLSWTGGMSRTIVVTVAAARDAGTIRMVDMLYEPATINGQTTGGGGTAFEDFLLNELRPFIEARYAADPARAILFGHSVGGLFAANLLARKPQAFDGYLIASPSVWADPGVIDRLKAAAGAPQMQRVFVGVGGAEGPGMVQGAGQVAAALGPRFTVQTSVYRDQSHLGYYPLLVATAFPWLVAPVK